MWFQEIRKAHTKEYGTEKENNMKKALTILTAALLIFALAACGGAASSAAPAASAAPAPVASSAAPAPVASSAAPADSAPAAGNYTIGVTFMTLNSPFFEAMQRGVLEEADALGVEAIISDAQLNVAEQINSVENLIAQQVDCILLNAVDSAAIVPAVEAANKANIPVICLDVMAEGGDIEAFIASDNVEAGRLAGEFIGEYLGGEGTVVILDGPPISSFQDRATGFQEGLASFDGIEIVQHINAVENSTTGFVAAADNILSAHPDLSAVLAVNDFGAMAVEAAVESAGVDFPVVAVGIDGMADVVQAITGGDVVVGSVAQMPADMGRLGVSTAVALLNGESIEAEISVPLLMLSKENAEGFTW